MNDIVLKCERGNKMESYKARFKEKDEQLFSAVEAFKNGDASKTTEIYTLTKAYLYKIIFDIVKNNYTTEDLLQDTYLQVFDKLDTLYDARAFYVWAGRIATNKTLRYLQREKKIVLNVDETDEDGRSAGVAIMDQAAMDHEEFIPENIMMDREKQRLLQNIIDGLSVEQKLCIQYYYYEEMSVKAIAMQMGCSEGTIKSRLNYARNSIKAAVVDLAENHGTKLYSLASLPLFYWLFRESVLSFVLPSAVGANAYGTASADSHAAGSYAANSKVGAKAAGTVAKAGLSTGAKVGVAAVAAVVIGVGAFSLSNYFNSHNKNAISVQEQHLLDTHTAVADTYKEMGLSEKEIAVAINESSEAGKKIYDALDDMLEAYERLKGDYEICLDESTYKVVKQDLFDITDQGIAVAVLGTEDFIGMVNEYSSNGAITELCQEYVDMLNTETSMLMYGCDLLEDPQTKNLLDTYINAYGGNIVSDMSNGNNLPTIVISIANAGIMELNDDFINKANTLYEASNNFMNKMMELATLASSEEVLRISEEYSKNNDLENKEYYKQLKKYYKDLTGMSYSSQFGSGAPSSGGGSQADTYACPNCGGTGWVQQFMYNDANGIPVYDNVVCPNCSGQGWLSY